METSEIEPTSVCGEVTGKEAEHDCENVAKESDNQCGTNPCGDSKDENNVEYSEFEEV